MAVTRGLGVGFAVLVGAAACGADDGSDRAGGSGLGGFGQGGSGASSGAGGTSAGGTTAQGGFGGVLVGGAAGTAAGAAGGVGGVGGTSGGAGTGGCSDVGGGTYEATETCGDGLDNDGNGFLDEGCTCTGGQTQQCFSGPPWLAGKASCTYGTQTCIQSGEFGSWGPCVGDGKDCTGNPEEICFNNIDDDCDGEIDEGCELEVPVDINGDCLTAACPAQAPYPVKCQITMEGGDPRGCVANTVGDSVVYFQEGDACGAGRVTGTLTCSSQLPTMGLDQSNCAINKPTKFFPMDKSGCPKTSG